MLNLLISIYPNPSSSELTVSYETDSIALKSTDVEEYQITLVNSAQEKIYSSSSTKNTLTIPVSKFPKGTYYLMLTNKDGTIQKRIMIDR